jgi:hypothetical protein
MFPHPIGPLTRHQTFIAEVTDIDPYVHHTFAL